MLVGELAVIVLLSQLVVESILPGACDEASRTLNESLKAGCGFLEDWGFHAIRIAPTLVLVAFAALAYRIHRVMLLHVGFAAAFALLVSAVYVSPSDYPWA